MTTSTATTPVATHTAAPRAAAAGHPLLGALADLDALSATMAECADHWAGLEALTIREACTKMRKIRARLDGHLMAASRVLEAAGTAKHTGATSTGAMLANDYGGNRRESESLVRTGATIKKAGATGTERALLSGEVTPEQARIISDGLLTLPRDTSESDRARCEQDLLTQAPQLSLPQLRRAADRVLRPIAEPPIVDAAENLTVNRREHRAWNLTDLTMNDCGDGTTTGRFRIPTLQATMLTTLLQAQSAPRRTHLNNASGGDGAGTDAAGADRSDAGGLLPDEQEDTTYSQRMGRAFCALIEHTPTDRWASSGGTPATLVITLDLPTLTGELDQKVATFGDHQTLSAEEARRLACEHGILPHVLSGASLPVDIGTTQRLFSTALRKMLAGRDQGCAFPGCDRPPAWCEAHHIVPVSKGGATIREKGVLLCAHHHRFVHQYHWDIRLHPDSGHAQFKPAHASTWRTHTRYQSRNIDSTGPPGQRSTADDISGLRDGSPPGHQDPQALPTQHDPPDHLLPVEGLSR